MVEAIVIVNGKIIAQKSAEVLRRKRLICFAMV